MLVLILSHVSSSFISMKNDVSISVRLTLSGLDSALGERGINHY